MARKPKAVVYSLTAEERHELQVFLRKATPPKIEPLKSVVFHGTSRRFVKSILENNFEPTTVLNGFPKMDVFLGKGTYFFQNSPHMHGDFAAGQFAQAKFKEPAVLRAEVDLQQMFDLTLQENLKYFGLVQGKLVEMFDRNPLQAKCLRLVEDWRVACVMIQESPHLQKIDGARWDGFAIPNFTNRNQYGICVKDLSAILGVSEVT